MYAITAATGQLGSLVVETLLKTVPAEQIIVAVRNPNKACHWAKQGVIVREADYDAPETMISALEGADKVLLISVDMMGRRLEQHMSVINAAIKNKVKLLAYTSVLNAGNSPLQLAEEHQQTEDAIISSGVPYVFLRNGWYTDNHVAGREPSISSGVFVGASGDGRWSSASRKDYAEAAVAVLTSNDDQTGKIYELAGDSNWTITELVKELVLQTGKNISYQNLSEADYSAALIEAGLPEPVAKMLADTDIGAAKGFLENNDKELSKLIGRPTTSMSESIRLYLNKNR